MIYGTHMNYFTDYRFLKSLSQFKDRRVLVRPQTNVIICLLLSLIHDLKAIHCTNEENTYKAKSHFISLVLSAGNQRLSINKILDSLLTKFLRTDGLNHNYTAKSSGDDLANSSTNS